MDPTPISDEVKAFIAHWHKLRRENEAMPRSAVFLDSADPKLQPFVSFNDITPDGLNTVVLYGTGLVEQWGEDLTGRVIKKDLAVAPAIQFAHNLTQCAVHPCGMREVSRFATSTGRVIVREIVTLPLGVKREGVMRLVRYHHLMERLNAVELFTGLIETLEKEWFDIGSGVPSAAPMMAMPRQAIRERA